jgi:hypothetical protein
MAKIQIVVRHNGAGWLVVTNGKAVRMLKRAQPYSDREEALSDALFSARMLNAMGDEAQVLVESGDGIKPVSEPQEWVWLKH